MLCNNCHQNHAIFLFVLEGGDPPGELMLCADCAARLAREHLPGLLQNGAFGSGKAASTADQFPQEAEPFFRRRRALNRLRAELRQAVKQEAYETAAKLRDRISAAERQLESECKASKI